MNVIKRVFGWIKFILLFLWLVFLVLIGAKLAQLNPQLIQVDLLFWTTPEASVGVVLCVTLLIGVVSGVAAMLPSLVLLRTRLRRAQGKVAKATKQKQEQEQRVVPVARDQALS